MLIVVFIQLKIHTILYYCLSMTIANNKRNIPRYGKKEKVISGFHNSLSNLKLKPKCKHGKSASEEILKIIESTRYER